MIKERSYSSNGRQIIRPNAFIVDWKNAMPAPYILDLARIISHCYREVVLDESVQMYSKKYCPIRCEEAIKNSFLSELKKKITGIPSAEFEKDLLCGEFFEIARMYIQMPTDPPHDSYDRYYCSCMQQLAEQVLSEI
jgi:thiamine kinase-like enzyme